MKEMLVGLETEYGLKCDLLALEKICGTTYLTEILEQVPSVLDEHDYARVMPDGEFWTRAGMRCYPDRIVNLEAATPECAAFEDLIFQKNTGNRLIQALVEAARPVFAATPYCYEGPLEVIANNTAAAPPAVSAAGGRSEVTYACHENYLLRRDLLLENVNNPHSLHEHIWRNAGAFMVARPVIGGSGHIRADGQFVLSPRADWVTGAVGGGTMNSRTFVNTRDEPHAQTKKFLRYHHVAGDTNITDRTSRMKIAFTYWVLRLIERGWLAPEPFRAAGWRLLSVSSEINSDPELSRAYDFGGAELTAVGILGKYLDAVDAHRGELLFDEEDEKLFCEAASFLEKAGSGYAALSEESEWAAKYSLLDRQRERLGLSSFNHPRLKMLSAALHNLERDPKKNPFAALRDELFPANADIGDLKKACRRAPQTRAFVRGLAVFFSRKFKFNITFPMAKEWSAIKIPALPPKQKPDMFLLNCSEPWALTRSDIMELVYCVRPLVRWKEMGLKPIMPYPEIEPFYGI